MVMNLVSYNKDIKYRYLMTRKGHASTIMHIRN